MFPFWSTSLPHDLSPCFYAVSEFGVGQNWRLFRTRTVQSVALPRKLARQGLSYGIFRKEPAIAKLDWSFATNRRSEEGFDCTTPTDLHPTFGEASSCPRLDRLASGVAAVTPGFINHAPRPGDPDCAHVAFASVTSASGVSLATTANSPQSYSKLTLQHRLPSPRFLWGRLFHAATDCSC